jgi:prepilin signal peptidase PulO-like enzyme (type II secretory pathway)
VLEAFLAALVGALVFGTAGVGGSLLATVLLPRLQRLPDGPEPARIHPGFLIAGAAVLGAFLGWRRLPNPAFIVAALTTVPMVAIWYCDSLTGIIPDFFTLIPLGLALAYELIVVHEPFALVSAVVLFAVFGVFAWLSKGRGMGWGDAKLAAFGGAMLGMKDASLAFAVGCLVAVIVGSIRYRSKPVPMVFAPYLIAAMALTIAITAR